MNARNDAKRLFDQNLDARLCWPRLGCGLPRWSIVSWLAGCSAAPPTPRPHNGCSRPIARPTRQFGMGVRLVVSSARWDESP